MTALFVPAQLVYTQLDLTLSYYHPSVELLENIVLSVFKLPFIVVSNMFTL